MVLSGRSFFSFAGTLEADLNKRHKACQEHIGKSSVRNIDCRFMSTDLDKKTENSRKQTLLSLPPDSSEVQTLCYNEISTWAYESSQLLPPCHCRYIPSCLTALNGLQSLPDILKCSSCSSESGQNASRRQKKQ